MEEVEVLWVVLVEVDFVVEVEELVVVVEVLLDVEVVEVELDVELVVLVVTQLPGYLTRELMELVFML